MKTKFKCFNCKKETEYDFKKGHIPMGWSTQTVNQHRQLFCEACSMHFVGGISSYMEDCLKKKSEQ